MGCGYIHRNRCNPQVFIPKFFHKILWLSGNNYRASVSTTTVLSLGLLGLNESAPENQVSPSNSGLGQAVRQCVGVPSSSSICADYKQRDLSSAQREHAAWTEGHLQRLSNDCPDVCHEHAPGYLPLRLVSKFLGHMTAIDASFAADMLLRKNQARHHLIHRPAGAIPLHGLHEAKARHAPSISSWWVRNARRTG